MNGLAWAWENVLLPLASWTIEEAAPAVLNLLAAALQAVYKVVSALAPILIVWLGNNIKTIIVAAVSVAVFGAIMTLHNGFSHTDPDQIKLIYSLGGKRKDVLTKVLLPGSIPLIISNMKVNVGLCLVGVIIGEFLAANKGLGYLIIYGSQVFKMDMVVMSIVILCIVSAVLYQGITFLEKRMKR